MNPTPRSPQVLTKNELHTALIKELEFHMVDEADEIADSVIEVLDEQGVFETEEIFE